VLSEKEKKVNLLEISNELTNYETLNKFLYFFTQRKEAKFHHCLREYITIRHETQRHSDKKALALGRKKKTRGRANGNWR
jgi:hypothetical protein